MTLRGFVAGLLVGLVAGYGLSGVLGSSPDAAPNVPEDGATSDAPPRTHEDGSHEPSLEGRAPGSGAETAPSDRPAVRTLVEEKTKALAIGDWSAFFAALEALGEADTPEADDALVAVLGDTSIRFQARLGKSFGSWLEGSRVDGIAAAARLRIEDEQSEFGLKPSAGLAGLIGTHGTAQDRGWVEGLGDRDATQALYTAWLLAASPEAVAFARDLFAKRFDPQGVEPPFRGGAWWHWAAVTALARGAPVVALALFDDEQASRDRRNRGALQFYLLFDVLSVELPPLVAVQLLPYLRAYFDRGLADERYTYLLRVILHTLDTLEGRGIDVAAFDDVRDWPSRFLFETARKGGPEAGEGALWSAATRMITLPSTWVPEARARLEATRETTTDEQALTTIRAVLNRMRRAADWDR